MSSKKYFGTDGIRGRVGEYPMTPEFALKLGWAAGKVLTDKTHNKHPKVVIGKDTRLSGYMFESALEAGFSAAGVGVLLVGPMPTPAIAYLTRTFHAQVGVVISASHNPFFDNGVKFFGENGCKLPDDTETQIEDMLEQPIECVSPEQLGRANRIESAPGRYVEFCKSTFRTEKLLNGYTLVVDCGHGATYHVAPDVFRELGARVYTIGDKPDGLNINQDCGSTSINHLQQAVAEHHADAGIALDGDGDRCIMVDAQGNKIDGDQLLYIIACSRQERGKLQGPVVGTQMSNLGLELALKARDIAFERVQVGDRYVHERLIQLNAILGGESSGHILCLDRTTTGDGIVTALQILNILVDSEQSLSTLLTDYQSCPQVMINVPVNGNAREIMQKSEILRAIEKTEKILGNKARVLIRPSGTEPLIRVMVEGRDNDLINTQARQLADQVSNLI